MFNINNYSNQFAKAISFLCALLLTTAFVISQPANTWTQKADFGGSID